MLSRDKWDSDRIYDEDPPICIHYNIEWKVTLNGTQISKDTELNLVLAPSAYWPLLLQPSLNEVVQRKMDPEDEARISGASIVVSVASRSERDFNKQFRGIDLQWSSIETQLVEWSDWFLAGKKIRMEITFHYVAPKQKTKGKGSAALKSRGRPSTTQRILAERSAQVHTEEDWEQGPSVWTAVYREMRCPTNYALGPHCWQDPQDKKHYKLHTHQLRSLVRFVQNGGHLQSQNDVPDNIRNELYAEAEEAQARKRAKNTTPSREPTPITINNHFPEHIERSAMSMDEFNNGNKEAMSLRSLIMVKGCHDTAVRQYAMWLQSQYEDPVYQDQVALACDQVLSRGLGLDQLYEDQSFQFLMDNDVMKGIAQPFVSSIKTWSQGPAKE